MSYALRNSLILLLVLLLFAAGGWYYIQYYQAETLAEVKTQVTERKNKLKQDQQIADQFEAISATFQEASTFYKNYEKALYRSSNEDKVFDFLTTLNRGNANNDFSFTFQDSTLYPQYGILNMQITGEGLYRNVINFMRSVELSGPLNKIDNVSITPIQVEEKYGYVSYDFKLKSYYERTKILEKSAYNVFQNTYASLNNPFFPLIRDIKANEDKQINVENSSLVAVSTDRVFLINQNGEMQQISIGEEVYLGKLSSINLSEGTATFTLNKGGIVESVKMGVDNENQQ